MQLYAKIAPNRNCYRYTSGPGKNSVSICDCTKAEAIQIQIEFEFYTRQWETEVDLFFRAFIQKHQIFGKTPDDYEPPEMDNDERLRMLFMMRGLQDKSPLRMIEGGGGHV